MGRFLAAAVKWLLQHPEVIDLVASEIEKAKAQKDAPK